MSGGLPLKHLLAAVRFLDIERGDEVGWVIDGSTAIRTGLGGGGEHALKIEADFVMSRFYQGPFVPQQGSVIMCWAVGGSQHSSPARPRKHARPDSLFEDRRLAAKAGVWEDDFAPCAVHVYAW